MDKKLQPCETCKWWERINNHKGECNWPVPLIPRVLELVRNVAWAKESGCSVWEN